ncbi:hypothetical protein [Nocardioides sp.]|jgi:hypothetical protein|uniref:hypothetical protein n=1 Tax=Nocardioides sp. TaxID=35761 RepID=UPI002C0E8893|nr:hypothetical protein [Nocardioides sp.]HVX55480.1 hypothetical protein [Nocardioides sp.]
MADYDVVLLVEQALTEADAARVLSLHEGLDDPVTYHVLLPVEDAAARIEAAMGSLPSSELLGAPNMLSQQVDLDAVQADARDRAQTQLADTLTALHEAGAEATGELVEDPIQALAAKVRQVDGREAIILTRPHVVAEFFHVDWTAQARRKLGVPVLHLLEHETFDEQAEGY